MFNLPNLSSIQIPADMRLHMAAVLILFAAGFCITAYFLIVPALAMCAGICFASAGRVAYAAARDGGLLRR